MASAMTLKVNIGFATKSKMVTTYCDVQVEVKSYPIIPAMLVGARRSRIQKHFKRVFTLVPRQSKTSAQQRNAFRDHLRKQFILTIPKAKRGGYTYLAQAKDFPSRFGPKLPVYYNFTLYPSRIPKSPRHKYYNSRMYLVAWVVKDSGNLYHLGFELVDQMVEIKPIITKAYLNRVVCRMILPYLKRQYQIVR